MTRRRCDNILLAGVLLSFMFGSAPAQAQLAVAPEEIVASVAQGETATHTVTLINEGSAALAFCLNLDRPLQRADGSTRISGDALGEVCGAYGEVLALINENDIPAVSWHPYGLAMTPEGQLFAAEDFNATNQTYELTPALEFVRSFPHPVVEELDNSAVTTGVTYNAATETLWWLNIEGSGFTVERALLLEGDLDGVATGRRIELPVAETAPAPYETGSPVGLVYDALRHCYYYVDFANDDLRAVDTLGNAVAGYPVGPEAYPGRALGFGLDAHPGDPDDAEGAEGTESLRFEVATNTPGVPGLRQIVVVGGLGEDTAPGAEPLETPVLDPLPGTEDGGMAGEPVRSVLDPNGVLYYPWSEFQNQGIVAVRPHPLPPSWLVVEAWDGALAPGESTEVALTFRPGGRALGDYTASLQAFEAETGEAVEVPLTLTVTPGTDAEEGAEPEEVARLSVYPNPASGAVTVALALTEAADIRVVVYDVLGRAVKTLHEGRLDAGRHPFRFESSNLPAGVYLVRMDTESPTGAGNTVLTRRVSVVR